MVEAAAELGPVSGEHEIALDVQPAVVEASATSCTALAINLIENALRHTPPGTEIRARTGADAGGGRELVVEDDGPGVPERAAPRPCSSASCAAPATAAAPSGSASRSCARSPSPTAAPSRSSDVTPTAGRASWCACRRLPIARTRARRRRADARRSRAAPGVAAAL